MRLINAGIWVLALFLILGCGNSDTSEETEDMGMDPTTPERTMAPAERPEGGDMSLTSRAVHDAERKDEGPVNENINVAEFNKRRLASSDVVILDVRTPGETAEGIIPGAIEIDYNGSNFEEELSKLDRSKEYLVYCEAGGRSGKTTEIMAEMGFPKVYNLEGGYTAWSSTLQRQE